MHALSLWGRPTEGEQFITSIGNVAIDWRRSSRALGGYWLGSFSLSGEDLSRAELWDFYETKIGCVLQEHSDGLLSWEGIVHEMRLTVGRSEFMISLRPEWWHNNVQIIYRSTVNNSRQTIAWSENMSSSDIYGEMRAILAIGKTTSAAATAYQGLALEKHAWPRSRQINSVSISDGGSGPDRLLVRVAGFWHTLNWLYQLTSITNTASTIVTTLANNSEFVPAGRVETNALSTYVEILPNPVRLGDAITSVVEQGDASFNLWKAGVYHDRALRYEEPVGEPEFYLRGGRLLDKTGGQVRPTLLEPGFLLYNSLAPTSALPPGTSSVWDDPRVSYVEQIEFIAPDVLRLRFYQEEEILSVLGEQIRHRTAVPRVPLTGG